jgi:hypothetical protein
MAMGQLTLNERRRTLLSYTLPYLPYCATLYPFELPNTLFAMLQPNWATYNNFVQFFLNAGLSGISVPQSGTGLRCWMPEHKISRCREAEAALHRGT